MVSVAVLFSGDTPLDDTAIGARGNQSGVVSGEGQRRDVPTVALVGMELSIQQARKGANAQGAVASRKRHRVTGHAAAYTQNFTCSVFLPDALHGPPEAACPRCPDYVSQLESICYLLAGLDIPVQYFLGTVVCLQNRAICAEIRVSHRCTVSFARSQPTVVLVWVKQVDMAIFTADYQRPTIRRVLQYFRGATVGVPTSRLWRFSWGPV